jgi:hypothetical protein
LRTTASSRYLNFSCQAMRHRQANIVTIEVHSKIRLSYYSVIHFHLFCVNVGLCKFYLFKVFSMVLSILQHLNGLPWRRGLVVSSLPATKETEAMNREIESCQGMGW